MGNCSCLNLCISASRSLKNLLASIPGRASKYPLLEPTERAVGAGFLSEAIGNQSANVIVYPYWYFYPEKGMSVRARLKPHSQRPFAESAVAPTWSESAEGVLQTTVIDPHFRLRANESMYEVLEVFHKWIVKRKKTCKPYVSPFVLDPSFFFLFVFDFGFLFLHFIAFSMSVQHYKIGFWVELC